MTENILMRAKRFIGLEGEDFEEISENTQQVKLDHFIRVKKEAPRTDGEYEIGFFEPKIYEDSLNIATNLRSGSPVIVSLKHLDPSEGTRLIDFVCGTAYAIDGHMMKIGDSIFLFTPSAIRINSSEDRGSIGEEVVESKRDTFFSR